MHNNQYTGFGSCYTIVKKPPQRFWFPSHFERPEDYGVFVFPIFGLVDCHCYGPSQVTRRSRPQALKNS